MLVVLVNTNLPSLRHTITMSLSLLTLSLYFHFYQPSHHDFRKTWKQASLSTAFTCSSHPYFVIGRKYNTNGAKYSELGWKCVLQQSKPVVLGKQGIYTSFTGFTPSHIFALKLFHSQADTFTSTPH